MARGTSPPSSPPTEATPLSSRSISMSGGGHGHGQGHGRPVPLSPSYHEWRRRLRLLLLLALYVSPSWFSCLLVVAQTQRPPSWDRSLTRLLARPPSKPKHKNKHTTDRAGLVVWAAVDYTVGPHVIQHGLVRPFFSFPFPFPLPSLLRMCVFSRLNIHITHRPSCLCAPIHRPNSIPHQHTRTQTYSDGSSPGSRPTPTQGPPPSCSSTPAAPSSSSPDRF